MCGVLFFISNYAELLSLLRFLKRNGSTFKLRDNWRIGFSVILALLLAASVSLKSSSSSSKAQERPVEPAWKTSLYEDYVEYGEFSCKADDSPLITDFFLRIENRPNRVVPICHNDCPVTKCRPVIGYPVLARAAKVTGTVSVHVLVDDQGRTIYSRILDGNPLLWVAARKAACETEFFPRKDGHYHQGVMHFEFDNSSVLTIPLSASQVL